MAAPRSEERRDAASGRPAAAPARALPAPPEVLARLEELADLHAAHAELRAREAAGDEDAEALRGDVVAIEHSLAEGAAWVAWAVDARDEAGWEPLADAIEAEVARREGQAPWRLAFRGVADALSVRARGPHPRALAFHADAVTAALVAEVERRHGPLAPDVRRFLRARLARGTVRLGGDDGLRLARRVLAQKGRLAGLLAGLPLAPRHALLGETLRFVRQMAAPDGLPPLRSREASRTEVFLQLARHLQTAGRIDLDTLGPAPGGLRAELLHEARRPARPDSWAAARALAALDVRMARDGGFPGAAEATANLLDRARRAVDGRATPCDASLAAALPGLVRHPDRGLRQTARDAALRALDPALAVDPDARSAVLSALADRPEGFHTPEPLLPEPASALARALHLAEELSRDASSARRRTLDLEKTALLVAERCLADPAAAPPLVAAFVEAVDALGLAGEPGRDSLVRVRVSLSAHARRPLATLLDRLARDAGRGDSPGDAGGEPVLDDAAHVFAELHAAALALEKVLLRHAPDAETATPAWRAAWKRVDRLASDPHLEGEALSAARLLAAAFAPPPSDPFSAPWESIRRDLEAAPAAVALALDHPDPWLRAAHLHALDLRRRVLAWLRARAAFREDPGAARHVSRLAASFARTLAVAASEAGAAGGGAGIAADLGRLLARTLADHPGPDAEVLHDDAVRAAATAGPETADALLEEVLLDGPGRAPLRAEVTLDHLERLLAAGAPEVLFAALAKGARHGTTRRLAAALRPFSLDLPPDRLAASRALGVLRTTEVDPTLALAGRRDAWARLDALLGKDEVEPARDLERARALFPHGVPAAVRAWVEAREAEVARTGLAADRIVLAAGPGPGREPKLARAFAPPDPPPALHASAPGVPESLLSAWSLALPKLAALDLPRPGRPDPPPGDPGATAAEIEGSLEALVHLGRAIREEVIPALPRGPVAEAWTGWLEDLAAGLLAFGPTAAPGGEPPTLAHRRLAFATAIERGDVARALELGGDLVAPLRRRQAAILLHRWPAALFLAALAAGLAAFAPSGGLAFRVGALALVAAPLVSLAACRFSATSPPKPVTHGWWAGVVGPRVGTRVGTRVRARVPSPWDVLLPWDVFRAPWNALLAPRGWALAFLGAAGLTLAGPPSPAFAAALFGAGCLVRAARDRGRAALDAAALDLGRALGAAALLAPPPFLATAAGAFGLASLAAALLRSPVGRTSK